MATQEWEQRQHVLAGLFREWTRLEGARQRQECRRGAVIYSAGEPSDRVFLLKSGKVKIFRTGPDEKRFIVHLVGPGDLFGEMALLGEPERENSAEVLEKAALWEIPRRPLLEWLRAHPEVWRELANLFGRRMRSLEGAVERLLFGEVEQRIIRLLLELGEQYGQRDEHGLDLRIALSQRELAHLVGSTRETTSGVLNRLRRRGWIRIRRRSLCLCSLADLARAAQKPLAPRIPPRPEVSWPAEEARPSGTGDT
ncbi:MAG: Crp/Fnr family transcriptional regulator [Acidobacteria bacterium]|nr:Crp/Fnr family transcriptional regulator [Acidobacteriota bacterium]